MRYQLYKGLKSTNGQVEIIDVDKYCVVVKNYSRGTVATRTISKDLLNEFVEFFEKYPNKSAQDARNELTGLSNIDRFEYGYASTLTTLAKMILGYELAEKDKVMDSKSSLRKHISEHPLQVIYYGAPGTGKSYAIDQQTDESNAVRTTFHPDSDYASFVGAYKPTMEEMPISAIVGKDVHIAIPQGSHPGREKKIVYKYVPQAFLKAYVKAWANQTEPQYLVIEEINRGNCAQIFGDLFQLLDRNNSGASSYPIHADEDIARFLKDDGNGFAGLTEEQRQAIADFVLIKDSGEERPIGQEILDGKLLLLPPNLHIWATMNTSDQSLFPIDSAFKRRWDWHYVPIDPKKHDKERKWKFRVGDNLYSWGDFLEVMNPQIYALTESSDKQMGYYFAKADPTTGIISEEVFLNKVLFYLWTEVFKDFDISSEIFMNTKENRSFRFTDFFEDPEAIVNFIRNLKLPPLESEEIDEDGFDEEKTGRDYARYSVNGEGSSNKRKTVLKVLESYIEMNPSLTADEIIEKWETVNPGSKYFIKTEKEYNDIISDYPAQNERYWPVRTGTDETIYLTNQWGGESFNTFVEKLNASPFGLKIEKIQE